MATFIMMLLIVIIIIIHHSISAVPWHRKDFTHSVCCIMFVNE